MNNSDRQLLTVEAIKKHYPITTALGRAKGEVKAVDGVSFAVKRERVFALVGESGCGKSTVARMIVKLTSPTEGKILYKGKDIAGLKGDELRAFRRSVQIVFQDPFASLNPRMRIVDTLAEPFRIHKTIPKTEIKGRVVQLLERVGLSSDALQRYPHEFSGGQRQRICIARALALSPELVIADEPLSALDVSIQAQIINLLQEIRQESSIAMVFISHDLNVVHYLSDEVGVMYLGKIVEMAGTEELFSEPKHPYTELLLASAPRIRQKRERKEPQTGDLPSPIDIPSGCPFHPRCPKRLDLCNKVVPELRESGDRMVACHLYR